MKLKTFAELMEMSLPTAKTVLKNCNGFKKVAGNWYVTEPGFKILQELNIDAGYSTKDKDDLRSCITSIIYSLEQLRKLFPEEEPEAKVYYDD